VKRFNSYPHELSGGLRQRVMIGMAMICKPKLLIADEPTTALDVTIQAQVLEVMDKAQDETGAATIMITHDLGVVAGMADDILVMYAGKPVEIAKAEEIALENELRSQRLRNEPLHAPLLFEVFGELERCLMLALEQVLVEIIVIGVERLVSHAVCA